jgi:hypothetical protein
MYLCRNINTMTTLTEIQVIFDTEFPKSTLDNKQVNLLIKQAAQYSLGEQFETILTIMASGLNISNETRLEILKYKHILNLIKVMNRKGTDDDKVVTEAYLEAISIFRENKLNSIIN